MNIENLIQISETEWEIPTYIRSDMRVPVKLFVTREMLEHIINDKSLDQAVNATTLPGLVGHVIVMPDMHQGYGFPIGGVAATEYPHGVISPGAIGYDINCGVRLLASSIDFESARREEADLARTEESGSLEWADPNKVSDRAKERGREQIGSVGAGNHFIEVDVVDQIFNEEAAHAMGVYQGCLVLQIHCGSRGLGHQVCTDYVQSFQNAVRKYDIALPDRELVCAPMDSPEGKAYMAAMRAAANFAFANRQLLAHSARRAFEETFAPQTRNWHLHQVYDIAHNMGKLETHRIAGKEVKVCVHRKGATRAFGPGSPGLPPEYQKIGQPVIIPGSMGTASWVLVGTQESMTRSFGSSCHGAGRVMSRSQAKKEVEGTLYPHPDNRARSDQYSAR